MATETATSAAPTQNLGSTMSTNVLERTREFGVIAVVALCALAVIYAPNLMELMLRIHPIPPH